MGGLRADVNVSVRRRDAPAGDQTYYGVSGLGQRTEIKNLSSFKAVEDAVRAEMNRQISVLEAGGVIEGETRRWTIGQTETKKLRGKEGEVDYRYMPDPDLSPVIIGDELLDTLKQRMPVLPDTNLEILTKTPRFGLTMVDAKTLMELDNGARLEYYKDAIDAYEGLLQIDGLGDPIIGRMLGNWVLHELGGLFSKAAEVDPEVVWSATRVPAKKLAEIVYLQNTRQITSSSAKQLLAMIFEGDERPVLRIVEEDDMRLAPMSKEEYVALAQEVMDAYPQMVEQVREKKQLGKIGFFVGQVVRRGEKGRVEAQKADEVLKELLLGK
ncbi:mitochondrial cytochrome c oxidase assembly factor [Ascosphaera apis ARSEF 7405]|uniref:Mitochondrial cytochrome c oxidase assembly factor n=1 Tax=Ascosphaera apis ARSEF 7405 TaxID=392613 RepID=A0A168AZK9_9EURO|nr:mitochondrial cytochrome c oxidase assembly factor [Ascosphaera apis ARSEF 7405]